MTAYTQSAPFEFEGGRYCFQNGAFMKAYPEGPVPCWERDAWAALIEAERDTWAWTKDDRSEASKGAGTEERSKNPDDIMAWVPAQPEEPTRKHAVVFDNIAEAWVRNRFGVWVNVDGIGDPCKWDDLIRRYGPVTVER